ncbi:MAG: proline dehydrogenase family protein [Deltaproteobacteria bacterium]|nr:proline dehydrogenase family protein [Deltaproteobacteria bacterium]
MQPVSILLKPFAKRFIGGETLEEALQTLHQLHHRGFLTTLDFLGESNQNRAEAEKAAEEYIANLKTLKKEGLDRNISIKLTQIGLEMDENFAKENFTKIAAAAKATNGFVRVDMEGSPYTEQTLKLTAEVHKNYPHVGVVLQSMLRRTPEDALCMLKEGIRVRLVKGAYKEPPSIAYPDKKETDRQYVMVMKRLLISGIYHAIATHDEKIIKEAIEFVKKEGIAKDSFEFQMLLGIRNKFAKKLLQEGYRLRIYVPYGKSWLPYMTRRLRERKENIWFVIKNIFRG